MAEKGIDRAQCANRAPLVALEAAIARALRAADPRAALAALAQDPPDAPPDAPDTPTLTQRIAAIDPEGFALAALLVARLRFERLIQGSEGAAAWSERAPEAFAAAFRRYHAEVPATAHFPADEAALFLAWARRPPG